MLQELQDRVASAWENNTPFVLYSKPNDSFVHGIFQKDNELRLVKDFSETGFVFAPFDLESPIVLLPADETLSAEFQADAKLKESEEAPLTSDAGREDYLEIVENAISELNSGKLKKVVLSRKVNVQQQVQPLELFFKVLAAYPKAFCYVWHHPKVGTWIGATPEILLKSAGREFTTMSLAGTQSAEEYPQPQWTPKELNEQQMVTDYILKAMKRTSVSVKTSAVESIKAGNLWHLRTKLTGKFDPAQFESILTSIHPTPAVCGIPLQNAKDFIRQHENYDRSFYTGFLGELNFKKEHSRNRNRKNQENSAYKTIQNTSELFVNLRCMQVYENRVEIYVGGGITSGSQPVLEWEETVNKSKTMLKVLGM